MLPTGCNKVRTIGAWVIEDEECLGTKKPSDTGNDTCFEDYDDITDVIKSCPVEIRVL